MMTNFRQAVRHEFPRRWWRTWSWWAGVARDARTGAVAFVAMVAAVLTLPLVLRITRHRDDPTALAVASRPHIEAYAIGLVMGTSCFVMAYVVATGGGPLWAAGLVAGWGVIQISACLVVLGTVAWSRVEHRQQWAELDFIEEHTPRRGLPPETVEEYEALRRASSVR